MSELIAALAPEALQKTPREIWNGHWTEGYPDSFFFGSTFFLRGGTENHQLLGKTLNELNLIPQEGYILDLGSGPCASMVFGKETTKERVYGIDYAPNQLARSDIDPSRQIVMDLRTADLLQRSDLPKHFSLITAFFLPRYLTVDEARDMYTKARKLGEKIIIVEVVSTGGEFKQVLGQQREFNPEQEKGLLQDAGFNDVEIVGLKVIGLRGDSYIGVVWAGQPLGNIF